MNWFLTFYRGRFVIRTRDPFRCVDCGHLYPPQVQAPAGVVLAAAVPILLAVLLVFFLWLLDRAERQWIQWAKLAAAAVVLGVGTFAAWVQSRIQESRLRSRHAVGRPSFGEILPDCPKCGSMAASSEESAF